MTATYEAIATTTLGSNTASVTFSSISGTYTDLIIASGYKNATNLSNFTLQFNDDTGTNYSYTFVYGAGSSYGSSRGSNQSRMYIGGFPSSNPSTNLCYLLNYSNSTTFKTVISRNSASDYQVEAWVNLWRSTSAITKIKLEADAGTFASGSTFTLYGIKAE